jgi:ribosome recycling factor
MDAWQSRMSRPVQHLGEQLRSIRSGTLTAGVITTMRVSVQGSMTPIGRLAKVDSQDGRIVITPFDRSLVATILNAMTESHQNAYALDPSRICVTIPTLSREQREQIGRHVRRLGEEAKVSIRSIRQEIRKQLASRGRRADRRVQEVTDDAIGEIELLVRKKLEELET